MPNESQLQVSESETISELIDQIDKLNDCPPLSRASTIVSLSSDDEPIQIPASVHLRSDCISAAVPAHSIDLTCISIPYPGESRSSTAVTSIPSSREDPLEGYLTDPSVEPEAEKQTSSAAPQRLPPPRPPRAPRVVWK